MNYEEFLGRVIDDGITAAKADYKRLDQAEKLRGSVDGFELCRSLKPNKLRELFVRTNKEADEKMFEQAADYWYWRCRAAEVEWVCNVVSGMLHNEGIDLRTSTNGSRSRESG